jgi:hypothetical protein
MSNAKSKQGSATNTGTPSPTAAVFWFLLSREYSKCEHRAEAPGLVTANVSEAAGDDAIGSGEEQLSPPIAITADVDAMSDDHLRRSAVLKL